MQIKRLGYTLEHTKTDNGGEFHNATINKLLLEERVIPERTSPYSPHQNGIAERSNRFICELAVAIMLDANVPAYLWPYAIAYVVYVTNRMPNKALGLTSSAFIAVHHKIPDVSRLRVFGCHAYMHLPDHQQAGMGKRAVKGICLGVDNNSLAYLVYIPSTSWVLMSCCMEWKMTLTTIATSTLSFHKQTHLY